MPVHMYAASVPCVQGWRMLLESLIDHEYPMAMKMEVEAPTVRARSALPASVPAVAGYDRSA